MDLSISRLACTKCVNSGGGIAIMVAVAIMVLCVGIAL